MRTNTELALLNNKNWLLPSPNREFQKSVAETSPFRPQQKKKKPTKPVNSSFVSIFPLFKLAKFGLLLIVLIQSSILSCIDNVYLFHSLFLFHIFLVPIQYHCYIAIIECSSGGLQVCLLFRE